DFLVSQLHRPNQRRTLVDFGDQRIARDRAGDFAVLMAAHAIGNQPDAEVGIGVIGVFIVLAAQTDMRAVAEFDHAQSTSLIGSSPRGIAHAAFPCGGCPAIRHDAVPVGPRASMSRRRDRFGAEGENRTRTLSPEPDFESGASTSSATSARGAEYTPERRI